MHIDFEVRVTPEVFDVKNIYFFKKYLNINNNKQKVSSFKKRFLLHVLLLCRSSTHGDVSFDELSFFSKPFLQYTKILPSIYTVLSSPIHVASLFPSRHCKIAMHTTTTTSNL